tara:strand:+ start:297 stop:635 length:339 start_codon:yes stop_codon:yes gene_type:complete
MGVIKFKRRDKNRFRKNYPYLRRKPVYETILEGNANIEVGVIDYNNTDTGTYNFTTTFTSIPTITATSVETVGGTAGNVNVYVESVSLGSVTIRVSDANFIGRVHLHAISSS